MQASAATSTYEPSWPRPGTVQDVVRVARAEMAADQQERERGAADEQEDRRGQARQILAGHQQFAAQRRQVVVVQRLLQHFAAEQVGEDAHAAEEDPEAQIVEVEQAGEDQLSSPMLWRPESRAEFDAASGPA